MSTSAKPIAQGSFSQPEPVIKVVSHTGLLYWWPVWVVGFVMSALTWLDGGRMAIVPERTGVKEVAANVYELTTPKPSALLARAGEATARGEDPFPLRVASHHNYGLVFIMVLLAVIVGSNVPLRGLSSLVAILFLFMLAMLLAYFDMWDWILERLGGLHIEISLAGYLVPSVVLLVFWVVMVFGFDRLRFIRFTAGQFVVQKEIGDVREIYDTTRVTVQKRRSDLFRHWILGLGSGDLSIQLPNQGKEIVLPDVLFVNRTVQQIADLMKTRQVTATSGKV